MNVLRAVLWVLALVTGAAHAHEIRPIYLQLDERQAGEIDVLIKLPVLRDEGIAAAYPVFTPGCAESRRAPLRQTGSTAIQTWRLHCAQPLAAMELRIEGFSPLTPDALVQTRFADGTEQHAVLSAAHPSTALRVADEEALPGAALSAYLAIGVEHILLGYDHLLFVLGLVLVIWRAAHGARVLVMTITAFTVAHSLTLALAVAGGVALPGAPVEALIALSILMLAVELARSLRSEAQPQGLTFRRPWIVAFVFGLLHGFGFAGALQETGLPEHAQAAALLLFNLGVELGQLLFVAVLVAAYRLGTRLRAMPMARVSLAMTWLLGTASAAWFLDRLLPAVFT
ncbi:HupE/UreJ family protein [Sinimarinibacterium flocculans]|uniref:HupE/UreJ family protein n=1 Tax=Sinimarinibacterium flocculans TaxID=985250 RepID=UPI0024933EB2|nr:HupE/UreJ family protein [Sinimarinibacterium flocculans]